MKNINKYGVCLCLMSFLSLAAIAQKVKTTKSVSRKGDVVKLDDLSTTLSDGGASDLTIDFGIRKKFQNSLPSKQDFKPEIMRSIRRIK